MSDDYDTDDEQQGLSGYPINEAVSAPSLYSISSYFRQAYKRVKIVKSVNEKYVREDLGFGCQFVDDVTNLSSLSDKRRQYVDEVVGKPQVIENITKLLSILQPCEPKSIVICDANILLHNLDVLEQSAHVMPNLVIPQTALVECRANRVVAYDRTVQLIRSVSARNTKTIDNNNNKTTNKGTEVVQAQQQRCSIFFPDPNHVETAFLTSAEEKEYKTINDQNDARIRKVAEYFGRHLLSTGIRVILLTDDKRSRDIASKSNSKLYEAKSVRSWVHELESYNNSITLSDLVAQTTGSEDQSASSIGGQHNKETLYFEPHVTGEALSNGVKSGLYHRCVLRFVEKNKGFVTIRRGEERVAVVIEGMNDLNRGVDGDVVAISIHPLDKWKKSSSSDEIKSNQTKEDTTNGIASDTAEPSTSDMCNVSDTLPIDNFVSLTPHGKVVGIIRRNLPTLSGTIVATTNAKKSTNNSNNKSEREVIAEKYEREHADGTTTCVFFAVSKHMSPILVRTSQRDRLIGHRIMVSMDSWPSTSPYPLGHYVRTIGVIGDKDVETQVLLYEHNIPHEPFPASVLACLPPDDYKIEADSSTGREDYRHLPVLSIDPPNCKDIDDALHCIELPNGNYEVGVHIADVTHYVKPGAAIDLEAANRSTSTYLVNKRLDMLPSLLTTDLCSLKGNVDRYAFSVLWEVTPDAEIVNVIFKKSIIHSIAALTYQQAQSMIDQPDDENDIQASAVKRLATIARILRRKRIDAGALTLASPEVKFALDSESLNPTDVQAYALLEANAVVEEFMLLANVTVAKKILRHYPTLSVLRRHPAPNRSMFDSLISKAKSRDLVIEIEDSKTLADSLDAANVENDPYINKLLRILSTRCMSPAQYFCSGEYKPQDWHHYGLAAPVYTHFTSPIRRYADVCVHRLLAAAIGVAPLPSHLSSRSYLHDLAENMNRRHRSAQLAGRASVQLHTLIFFAGEGEKEEDAYILDIDTTDSAEPSFTVMVPRYGIEGRVKFPIASDDAIIKRYPVEHKLVYLVDDTTTTFQVFDCVRVRIWVRESADGAKDLILDLVHPLVTKLSTKSTNNNPSKDRRKRVRDE